MKIIQKIINWLFQLKYPSKYTTFGGHKVYYHSTQIIRDILKYKQNSDNYFRVSLDFRDDVFDFQVISPISKMVLAQQVSGSIFTFLYISRRDFLSTLKPTYFDTKNEQYIKQILLQQYLKNKDIIKIIYDSGFIDYLNYQKNCSFKNYLLLK